MNYDEQLENRKGSRIIYLFFCLFLFAFSTANAGEESMILKKSEDGNFIVERLGNSVYVRMYNVYTTATGRDETRRYMDITPLMSPAEFKRISKRIATIGWKEMVQKPALDYWRYNDSRFGRIATSHELSPYWDPYPRHDINIGKYMFIYYPKGNRVNIADYYLSVWNYNVPDYQEGHVYVKIDYDISADTMTDEELFEASRIQIENLKEL